MSKGKKSVKKSVQKSVESGSLVPARNGGAIRHGSLPGNTPGTGRPPDEVRAKMRELGATKGLPFLSDLLDGKIQAYLVGKCEQCQHEQGFDAETMEYLMEQLKVSVEQRLKATEQAFKYGLQAKELVIASGNAASFFDCVHQAIVELYGSEAAEAVKGRAMQMMGGTTT